MLAGVNNQESLKAFITEMTGSNIEQFKKVSDNEYSVANIEGFPSVTIYYNDKVVVISSNPASIEAAKSGKAKTSIDSKIYAQINNGFFTLWSNKLGMQVPSIMSQANNLIDEDVKFFENMIESFSSYMKPKQSHSEWILVDKSKNSLELLMREFLKIGVLAKKQSHKYNDDFYEEDFDLEEIQ